MFKTPTYLITGEFRIKQWTKKKEIICPIYLTEGTSEDGHLIRQDLHVLLVQITVWTSFAVSVTYFLYKIVIMFFAW